MIVFSPPTYQLIVQESRVQHEGGRGWLQARVRPGLCARRGSDGRPRERLRDRETTSATALPARYNVAAPVCLSSPADAPS